MHFNRRSLRLSERKCRMATTATLELPRLEILRLRLSIVGTSPLLCHKWSEKAKKAMLDKQTGKAKVGKEPKNPEQDYQDSLYHLPEGGFGFPSIAFKAAAVRAGTYAELKMTYLRGAFHIPGEYVTIEGTPRMREDMVRIGMGTADLRYRGEFPEWATTIDIDLNERALTTEQLVNLFRVAGFSVGIGEYRPEKDGSFGRFDVVEVAS